LGPFTETDYKRAVERDEAFLRHAHKRAYEPRLRAQAEVVVELLEVARLEIANSLDRTDRCS
jgi:hypothetical protein